MPVKRPVDDDGDAGALQHAPAKLSRHDLQIEYDAAPGQSASARKKGVSNRTGQACDRCKVRTLPLYHRARMRAAICDLTLTLLVRAA